MATIMHGTGSNTWRVSEGAEAFRVWRVRGSGPNDEPRGWSWTVQVWRAGGFAARAHWHKLPPYGPKATAVIAIVERMLEEVR